jgi:AraC-like DNA-binding protein
LASPGYTNTLLEADTGRMYSVYAYVMKHFKQKMALIELASITHMTPTSFSRYFKLHANKSFSQFVIEIRIGHACKLLIEEKLNISQACYESGFQTLSNFNKQFKNLTQRTPLAYKKEYEVY